MAKNNQWPDWLKCNVLEIVILIVVLLLLVKVYSAPTSVPTIEENLAVATEEVLEHSVEDAAPVEAPLEEAPTIEIPVEEAPAEEQSIEAAASEEPAVEETPAADN